MTIRDYTKVVRIDELPQPDGVYILHFDKKLKHCGHYVGWSKDIVRRVKLHKRNASGVGIIKELHRLGITFEAVLFFPGATKSLEYFIKKSYKSTPKLCPVCKSLGWTPTPIYKIHTTNTPNLNAAGYVPSTN